MNKVVKNQKKEWHAVRFTQSPNFSVKIYISHVSLHGIKDYERLVLVETNQKIKIFGTRKILQGMNSIYNERIRSRSPLVFFWKLSEPKIPDTMISWRNLFILNIIYLHFRFLFTLAFASFASFISFGLTIVTLCLTTQATSKTSTCGVHSGYPLDSEWGNFPR